MDDSKDWKIYTRTGDQGETSLIGGDRVPKYHLKIESYGTLDELNSVMGMLRDLSETAIYKDDLLKIQDRLFTLESHLAAADKQAAKGLPKLKKSDISFLEHAIDQMNEGLPELTHFVLPGGHPAVSWAHIARTVCRRAERLVIKLSDNEPVDPLIIQYLNRLSDYLFVLSRRLGFQLNAKEDLWNPSAGKK